MDHAGGKSDVQMGDGGARAALGRKTALAITVSCEAVKKAGKAALDGASATASASGDRGAADAKTHGRSARS